MTTRREFMRHGIALAGSAALVPWMGPTTFVRAGSAARGYVCPPCGCRMDGHVFDAPGKCPACDMTLVEQQAVPFQPKSLARGRGTFLVAGGIGHEAHRITVAYYMPSRFSATSRILLVLPGSGRDPADYLEPWIARAEQADVLVAALGYPDVHYDFAAYHLGGTVRDLQIRNAPPAVNGVSPSVLRLRDEDISFTVDPRRERWIFRDFDRIFRFIATATGSRETQYDIFGHSAGGQILHRLALFHPASSARRIVAGNAGFYTLPTLDEPPLSGMQGTGITERELAAALGAPLLVLLGALDNDPERGGIHLHTPKIDRQGDNRLARGKSFFAQGERKAREMKVPFGWRLQVVPGVGHDHEGMGAAAARELYGV